MHPSTRFQTVRAALWLAACIAGWPLAGTAESVVRFANHGTAVDDDLLLMVPEAIGTLDLPVERAGDLSTAAEAGYRVRGDSALAGYDYTTIQGWIRFEPGESRQTVPLTLLQDNLAEETEYLEVALYDPGAGVVLGVPSRIRVGILDAQNGAWLHPEQMTIGESVQTIWFDVRLPQQAPTEVVTVDYTTVDGSAVAGEDYAVVAGTLTFQAGELEQNLGILVLNDARPEHQEWFQLMLSNPTGGINLGQPMIATISIEDNDPGIGFAEHELTVSENCGQLILNILRGNDFDFSPFVVTLGLAGTTARAGVDFELDSQSISFGSGELLKPVIVTILDDGVCEATETLQLEIVGWTGTCVGGSEQTVSVRIEDDDPGASFVQPDYWVSEAAGEIRLNVRRGNSGLAGSFTVDYSTVPDTATAGVDFAGTTGTLVFAEADEIQSLVIPILNDGVHEEPETFYVELNRVSGEYGLGLPRVALINIGDNDPGVSFTQTDLWVSEGAAQVVLAVQRGNDVLLDPFDVIYTTTAGTATAGADFEATRGTLTFGAGELLKTVVVPIINDSVREELESFEVSLENPPGQAVVPSTQTVYVNIGDNDPGVQWISNWSWVSEAAGVARIPLRRGNDVDLQPITVDYNIRAGTATAGSDFVAGTGSVQFAEGELEVFVEVPVLNDSLREETEAFQIVLLTATSPLGLAPEPVATVDIGDNDPGAAFSGWSWEADELQGTVELTVVRGNDVDLGRMTVDYRLEPQTAQPDLDYVEASGTVVLEENEMKATFAVTVLDDLAWEGDEDFSVRLLNHSGSGTLSLSPQVTVRILDNDPVGWSMIRGFPEMGDARDLAVGNNRWIIPGHGPNGPALLTSTNGMDWQRWDDMPFLVRLVYGADEFLAVSDQGEILASTNAFDWESRGRIVIAGNWPEKLVYADGRYLLLEGDGRTWVSTDGESWSMGTIPQPGSVRDVAFGAGTYVAVSDQCRVLTSRDGLVWEIATILVQGEILGVAYGDGQFVVIGHGSEGTGDWRGVVLNSADGHTWDPQWFEVDWWANDIAYGNGRFVLVREATGKGRTIWNLTRAQNRWQLEQVSDLSARMVASDGKTFVALSSSQVLFSADGVEWSNLSASWRQIVHEAGSFVVGVDTSTGWTTSHAIMTSSDLERWTQRAAGPGHMHYLHRHEGELKAVVGDDGHAGSTAPIRLLESHTSAEWDPAELRFDGWVSDAVCQADTAVVAGQRYVESLGADVAMVWTSIDDGATWRTIQLHTRGSIYTVRWIEDHFLAVGNIWDVGEIRYVSSNGLDWTQTHAPIEFYPEESEALTALRVGVDSGRLWLKRGGQPWLGYQLPGGTIPWDVTYAEGRLVAVGDRSSLWVSTPLIQLEPTLLQTTPEGQIHLQFRGLGPPGRRVSAASFGRTRGLEHGGDGQVDRRTNGDRTAIRPGPRTTVRSSRGDSGSVKSSRSDVRFWSWRNRRAGWKSSCITEARCGFCNQRPNHGVSVAHSSRTDSPDFTNSSTT
jgi:hypothetical protein